MMKYRTITASVFVSLVLLLGAMGPVMALTNPYLGCGPGTDKLNTALGCIPIKTAGVLDPMVFIKWVIGKMIYVASGVAFLLMVYGGIRILTSAGSAESIKAGSELITAALTGLLFIIFSILILRLIGADILQLPGFGS